MYYFYYLVEHTIYFQLSDPAYYSILFRMNHSTFEYYYSWYCGTKHPKNNSD